MRSAVLPLSADSDFAPAAANDQLRPLEVRHYRVDGSVFIDGHYLIKGVAGAILWKLLNDHLAKGRSEFCYRELRRDPQLKLPDLVDNLGARMILLQKRLEQQCPQLKIEKIARGLFRFSMARAVELQEV